MFLHIDIDCFFASAERSIDPTLKGIPMAVGGRSNLEIFNKKRTNIRLMDDNDGAFVTPVFYSDKEKTFNSFFVDTVDGIEKIRGIITTSSYEARAFGVRTAMPIAHAIRLCPQLVVVPSHYLLYHQLSGDIREFVQSRIPSIEQYSIDEFFGNVSGWIDDNEVEDFAHKLKEDIQDKFDIPVSIGISKAKWIAKLATEYAKPYGVHRVKNIDSFIADIPISKFPGIGKSFAKRLEDHYITTLGQIKNRKSLLYSWKKAGSQLYHRITGTDNETINPRSARKSIGISRTFDEIYDADEVRRRVMIMARHIIYIVLKHKVNPTLYYLKINYEYGVNAKITHSSRRKFSEKLFKDSLLDMYKSILKQRLGAIKITINVSQFSDENKKTLDLFHWQEDSEYYALGLEMHRLREKYGLDIIKSANEL